MTKKILKAKYMNKCIGCYSCMLACARVIHKNFSVKKSAIRIRTGPGGMVADTCLACLNPACAVSCPTGALVAREGGGIKNDPQKCIGCKKCVGACPIGYIVFDQRDQKPIVCIECGTCVKFCPNDVLVMEEKEHAE